MNQIEYKVRAVTRFIVTRYETEPPRADRNSAGMSSQHGEFDNYDTAYAVGYALANADAQRRRAGASSGGPDGFRDSSSTCMTTPPMRTRAPSATDAAGSKH